MEIDETNINWEQVDKRDEYDHVCVDRGNAIDYFYSEANRSLKKNPHFLDLSWASDKHAVVLLRDNDCGENPEAIKNWF